MKLRAVESQIVNIMLRIFKEFADFDWKASTFDNLKQMLLKRGIIYEMTSTEKLIFESVVEKKHSLQNLKGITFDEFTAWRKAFIKKENEIKGFYLGTITDANYEKLLKPFENRADSSIKEDSDNNGMCYISRVCVLRFNSRYFWTLLELKLKLVKNRLFSSFDFYYFQKGYTLIFKIPNESNLKVIQDRLLEEVLTSPLNIEENIVDCERSNECLINRFMNQYLIDDSSKQKLNEKDFHHAIVRIVNDITKLIQ